MKFQLKGVKIERMFEATLSIASNTYPTDMRYFWGLHYRTFGGRGLTLRGRDYLVVQCMMRLRGRIRVSGSFWLIIGLLGICQV